ncbi:hypothetical protein diail_2582 [Diaporthe ilicicola]|nr:hypothetical protein diail_2582 [Diaporthe ilicicola]
MSRLFHIRYAREDELVAMAQLSVTAFRQSGRQVNAALFPERLRVNPGDTDEVRFSIGNMAHSFRTENHSHIVAVDEQNTIMGWAEWTSGDDPIIEMTPDEREKERAERVARVPKSLDLEAAERLGREAGQLSKKLEEALGEGEYHNSWSRSDISPVEGDEINRMLIPDR